MTYQATRLDRRFVSHRWICMYNSDILDLYGRVGLGTKVVVLALTYVRQAEA